MIPQYRASSPPASECHHPYKDLSGHIPTVSGRLVSLQTEATFTSGRKMSEKAPKTPKLPRDGAVQPTQGKRKYIFIRKVVLDVLKVYVNEM